MRVNQLVDIEELILCQRFRSEDTDTTTDWSVHAEQCVAVNVTDGIAVYPIGKESTLAAAPRSLSIL